MQSQGRPAGGFAQERFRERKRTWLRRVWWVLPLGAAFEVAVFVGFGALLMPAHMELFWGLGIGVAAAMVMCLADSPPQHIERWRDGAEGERATARALRPLLRDGWTLLNDVERRRGGNIDHILLGPNGVFVLETKNLRGRCSVSEGVLQVRWREDPADGYEIRTLTPRTKAAAAEVSQALKGAGLSVWVQPVVVLWSGFEQQSVLSGKVAWIRGKDLAATLKRQSVSLTAERVQLASTALAAAFTAR